MKRIALTRKSFAYPYIIYMAIFVVFPLIILLLNAFISNDGEFTFSHFQKVFSEPTFIKVFWNSVKVGILSTAVCLLIGYPVAFILSKMKGIKGATMLMLFILPMWINSLLRTQAIRALLESMGVVIGKESTLMPMVVLAMVYDYLPFMILPIYTTLTKIDNSLLEAAGDLGANSLNCLVKVTIPLSVPGVISGILMVFLPSISTFAITDILTGGKFVLFGNMIDEYVTKSNYGRASVLSLMLLIFVALSLILDRDKSEQGKAGGGLW